MRHVRSYLLLLLLLLLSLLLLLLLLLLLFRRERLRERDFLNTKQCARVNQRHFGGKT